MYVPSSFKVTDEVILLDFIKQHSFCTLVTTHDGSPYASHIPVLKHPTRNVIQGHIAAANPQTITLDQTGLMIFTGPHCYISPTLYKASPAVPTWNYSAVHIYGQLSVLSDTIEIKVFIDRLVNEYEAGRDSRWSGVDDVYFAKMIQAVTCFEIQIDRIEGKFKLSQNRSLEDQLSVFSALSEGTSEERAVAKLMRQVNAGLDKEVE